MPFLSTPGLRIHFEQGGTGSTVLVLVHGNVGSWRWWQPIIENPPAGVTVYAPEIRGYGDSEHTATGYTIEQFANDLLTFVDAMGLNKFFLGGHSLGGAVAMQFALHNQHRVHALLLIATAPAEGMLYLAEDSRLIFGMNMRENRYVQLFTKMFNLDRAFYSRALTMITPRLDHSTPLFQSLVTDAVRTSPVALKGSIGSLITWNISGLLPGLALPVTVISGEKDTVVKRDALERMVAALPAATFEIWKGVGHAPQLEDPERFSRVLSAILSSELIAARDEITEKKTPGTQATIGRAGLLSKIRNWIIEKLK
ncbi:MAG: alpha/beta hydrolase [Desulfuromonadaceae bacterium]|nr:alpha/beta hydrolase [Desulfuromonadaceae bacterium]